MSGRRRSSGKSTPSLPQQQTSLASFFGHTVAKRRRRSTVVANSAFGKCPMCQERIPNHRLLVHASQCEGPPVLRRFGSAKAEECSEEDALVEVIARTEDVDSNVQDTETEDFAARNERMVNEPICTEPLPGLFLYEDFLSENEEAEILRQLDADAEQEGFGSSWKPATFNGRHFGQRWGVHCNLRSRQVLPAERPLPPFCVELIGPKLIALSAQRKSLREFLPNEMNAIDYRKSMGHSLSAHVDDRHLSKEVIVNISLAGDCTMTFAPIPKPRARSADSVPIQGAPVQVLLKRRCLQVLSGPARYQYTHGIANEHLHEERRVSLTLRESPLTAKSSIQSVPVRKLLSNTWWKSLEIPASAPPETKVSDRNSALTEPQAQALPPGLFLFPNFISEEEEAIILQHLDQEGALPKWSVEQHTGNHREKRWGVDHDLWSRSVRPPKHAIPPWMNTLLIQRFPSLLPHVKDAKLKAVLHLFQPNDVNAIEYRRDQGHSLAAHVDDRQKHKEVIANLSLAGDCFMTYTLESARNAPPQAEYRVALPRRTLQLLTGRARYDYRHGIAHADLVDARRVSLTLRDTRP